MATIYFTNNASGGDGSLVQAFVNASDGDVIAPDPTVFPAGTAITVALAARLDFSKSLTLDAGATRLRVQRTTTTANGTIYAQSDSSYFRAVGVEFIGRVIAYATENTFRRCFFGGNDADSPEIGGASTSSINLYDCVVVGCRSRAILTNGAATIVRSTIAGNGADISVGTLTATDSIVDPVCSTVGFWTAPPDSLDTSQALPWSSWNLHILPSSSYATGATTAAGEYDVKGNLRGRVVSGSTVYAVGAFEVVDADYVATSLTASFADPNCWLTPSKTRPESIAAGTFYFGMNVAAIDAPPVGSSIVVGDGATLTLAASAVVANLKTGLGTKILLSGTDRFLTVGAATIAQTTIAHATRGYFAAPTGTPLTGATFSNVVSCASGAGASNFVQSKGVLSWDATVPTVGVLLEIQNGDAWTTLANPATEYTARIGAGTVVRLFDGEKFLTLDVQYSTFWRIDDWATVADGVSWTVDAWAETLGDDATFSVQAWAIDPEIYDN